MHFHVALHPLVLAVPSTTIEAQNARTVALGVSTTTASSLRKSYRNANLSTTAGSNNGRLFLRTMEVWRFFGSFWFCLVLFGSVGKP